MRSEIALFDVCNTLYDSNTTFDFIRYVLVKRNMRVKLAIFSLMSVRWSPVFIGLTVLSKLKRRDLIRSQAVALLKGISRTALEQLSRDFYVDYLVSRSIKNVMELLKCELKKTPVCLISNSLEPVISVIAGELGVAFEATQLEYNTKGVFTGHIKRDLHSRKWRAFLDRFGKETVITMMCSDNKSDWDILQHAEKRYVVVYRSSDKFFWRNLNPVFIEKY